MKRVLAFDFGASGGRAMLAECDGSNFHLTEVHRFQNEPEWMGTGYYWDTPRLWHEMKTGLLKAREAGGFHSIAIDTWGVDFGLLGKNGELLGLPRHYRDSRNEAAAKRLLEKLPARELYARTGIQYQPFNTIFQLCAMGDEEPWLLENASHLLFLPDLFSWMLTGKLHTDYTQASTSGLLNPQTRDWDWELLARLGLPEGIFAPIGRPGETIGTLRPSLCEELGLSPIPVISVASHDTASAVAAVPNTSGEPFVYISCGTWSLFGTELPEPQLGEESLAANFTNEGGADGSIRYLKNIMGLWLIQQSRRHWNKNGRNDSYDDLENLARDCTPFRSLIDGDDSAFYPPGDMPARAAEFCRRTGQPVPGSVGETMRCLYDSIALKYRVALDGIQKITGRKFSAIHMIGGGIQDKLLSQLTADVCGVPVIAGPIEATAAGNAAVQLIALGVLRDIPHARRVIRSAFPVEVFEPHPTVKTEEAVVRYGALLKLNKEKRGI